MKNLHTPTPWAIKASEKTRVYRDEPIMASAILADTGSKMLPVTVQEANAAFIVLACNTHQILVDALEDAREAVEFQLKSLAAEYRMYPNGDIQQGDIDEADELLVKVNIAIAKAEGVI